LRLILLAVGIFLIVCVYVWGRYKSKLLDFFNRQDDEYEELMGERASSAAKPKSEPVAVKGKSPAFSLSENPVIIEEVDDEDYGFGPKAKASPPPAAERKDRPSRAESLGAPFLIQISVVAGGDGCFNGEALRDALLDLDLIHGDMGIYHRYDREYRHPLFSVASLVEPGTFPLDMENFECPGVIMFFQPPQVDQPLAVFEDLVNACHKLAESLGGAEWDEKRQPLTDEKISLMRARLREAY
jgi:cell division protein ZipA